LGAGHSLACIVFLLPQSRSVLAGLALGFLFIFPIALLVVSYSVRSNKLKNICMFFVFVLDFDFCLKCSGFIR